MTPLLRGPGTRLKTRTPSAPGGINLVVVMLSIFVFVLIPILILILVFVLIVVFVFVAMMFILIIVIASCVSLARQRAGSVNVGASQSDGVICQDTPDNASAGNGYAPSWAARQNVPLEKRWQRRGRQCHSGADRPKHVTWLRSV